MPLNWIYSSRSTGQEIEGTVAVIVGASRKTEKIVH